MSRKRLRRRNRKWYRDEVDWVAYRMGFFEFHGKRPNFERVLWPEGTEKAGQVDERKFKIDGQEIYLWKHLRYLRIQCPLCKEKKVTYLCRYPVEGATWGCGKCRPTKLRRLHPKAVKLLNAKSIPELLAMPESEFGGPAVMRDVLFVIRDQNERFFKSQWRFKKELRHCTDDNAHSYYETRWWRLHPRWKSRTARYPVSLKVPWYVYDKVKEMAEANNLPIERTCIILMRAALGITDLQIRKV